MIRIDLDQPTIDRTRIAISPLWECIASLRLLARHPGEAPWPYTAWAKRARRALAEIGPSVDADYLVDLCSSPLPDFVTPLPPAPDPTIEQELAALRATDPEIVHAELAAGYSPDLPAHLADFRDHPAPALDRLADTIGRIWDATLADHWPALRSALEEDVILRARSLALAGPDALLGNLHERIRWDRPTLTVVKPATGGQPDYVVSANDKRLLLVPLIFSRGAMICHFSDPGMLAVSYQSRGAVSLTDRSRSDAARALDSPPDRLTALLGRGRAAVLHRLVNPQTTAGIAADLGLARSSVSEHLSGLEAAGIISRNRIGRRVFYGLEPNGVTLVKMFGDDQGFG